MSKSWEVAVNSSCLLGEGPVWDIKEQCIYWVDILQCQIHQFFPSNGKLKSFRTVSMIGALALTESGAVITAQSNGLFLLDLKKETTHLLANPEEGLLENRFNDGKCDPIGRFWVGTMSLTGAAKSG